jgi:hypothetical protein
MFKKLLFSSLIALSSFCMNNSVGTTVTANKDLDFFSTTLPSGQARAITIFKGGKEYKFSQRLNSIRIKNKSYEASQLVNLPVGTTNVCIDVGPFSNTLYVKTIGSDVEQKIVSGVVYPS